jgi:tRNA (guanine37-N1)-methyltransferase
LTPKGEVFNQKLAVSLSKHSHLVLLNGNFEGIDQRVIDLDIDKEISIGDFVLTAGDLASMIIINATARLVDGVLGKNSSLDEESFTQNLLEYPHYTRPQEFMGLSVPEVLVSGNHQQVKKWRDEQSKKITKQKRPDILDK